MGGGGGGGGGGMGLFLGWLMEFNANPLTNHRFIFDSINSNNF